MKAMKLGVLMLLAMLPSAMSMAGDGHHQKTKAWAMFEHCPDSAKLKMYPMMSRHGEKAHAKMYPMLNRHGEHTDLNMYPMLSRKAH